MKESVKKNPLLVLSAINALNNWDYNSFEKEWIQMMKTVNSLKKDDAKVIVTTIYNPAGNMKLPSTLNKIVEDIIENMNAIIEKRAGKYDYEIADVYQSSVTSHLQKDGVHPDSQGSRSLQIWFVRNTKSKKEAFFVLVLIWNNAENALLYIRKGLS